MKVISSLPKVKQPKRNEQKIDEPLQLDLGLKQSPLNRFFEVRQKLDKIEDRIKSSNFWKNPLIWILMLFPVAISVQFILVLINHLSEIPDNVPLIRLNSSFNELFLPKYWLFILPAVIVICGFVSAALFKISYRRLEKFIFLITMLYVTLSAVIYIVVFNILGTFT